MPHKEYPPQFRQVLSQWQNAIGNDFVLVDPSTLQQYQTATYATSQNVFAVLQPANSVQVAACVAAANQHRIPVYPVSRGKNWGLGSRVPVSDSVILALHRLASITDYDEHFGTVTVDPGVTFQQLSDFLCANNSQWFFPAIGGPPQASVIGNIVERGDGVGPPADRLAAIASLEVVLADGSVIYTGYERFGSTQLSALSASPAGPRLHELFTQSNFGIVVSVRLLLTRTPKHLQLVQGNIQTGSLAACVEALQPVVSNLGESITLSIWNGHKLNARESSPQVAADAWFFTAGLYAPSSAIAAGQRELVVEAIPPSIAQISIFDQANTPDLRERAGLFLGVPNDLNTRSLYCEKPQTPPGDLDPDRDRCGAIWVCPEVPFHGETVHTLVGQIHSICTASRIKPVIGMSALGARTFRVFISLFYDREIPGEDARAMLCHDQLRDMLLQSGCPPFRLGVHSMGLLDRSEPVWDYLRTLKRATDPNNILAPGRYLRDISTHWDPPQK